jgi:uncharacterized protein (DUF697 family)/GTP-binding protein EngB required for normal cell division
MGASTSKQVISEEYAAEGWSDVQSEMDKIPDNAQDVAKLAEEEFAKNAQTLKQARIILVGKTGAGKSTTINTTLDLRDGKKAKTGIGAPVTSVVGERFHNDSLVLYDSPGIELGLQHQHAILDFIHAEIAHKSIEEQLHCVWYFVNGAGRRVEDDEIKLIRQMPLPVFVIITHADFLTVDDYNQLVQRFDGLPFVRNVFSIRNADDSKLVHFKNCTVPDCDTNDVVFYNKSERWKCTNGHEWPASPQLPDQKKALVEATHDILPESVRAAFVRIQTASKKLKIDRSVAAIISATIAAGMVGASPIPFSDAVLLVPLQVTLFVALCVIWNLPFDQNKKFVVAHTALQSLISFGGLSLASALKLIPGVGTILGIVINTSVASVLTAAIGVGYTIGLNKVFDRVITLEHLDGLPWLEMTEIMGHALRPRNIRRLWSNLSNAGGSMRDKVTKVLADEITEE